MVVLGTAAAVLFGIAICAVAQFTRTHRVLAPDTDTATIWAASGASRVVVDGDSDLDCYVYGRNGQLLGMDGDFTDDCLVDIWQRYSGTIEVEIVNLAARGKSLHKDRSHSTCVAKQV